MALALAEGVNDTALVQVIDKIERVTAMRIRKRHIENYLVVSPSWVSNGRWAVRRSQVSNMPLMATEEVATAWLGRDLRFVQKEDAEFEKFCSGDRREFTVTNIQREGYQPTRLLAGKGIASWVNPDYLDMLSIYTGATFYAKDGLSPLSNAKTTAETTIVLMPMRLQDLDRIETSLREWLVTPPQACLDRAEEHAAATTASEAL